MSSISRLIGRVVSPSLVAALVALAAAASGGAYAAVVTGAPKSIVACVHHSGGGLYVRRTCSRTDRRVVWSVAGPAGSAGPQGPPGPQGIQGPPGSPDTSQFYSKVDSDARFVHGSGQITTIPLVDLHNGGSGPLVDVARVGKLAVSGCALGNSAFRYTNESGVSENFVLTSAFTTRNNPGGDPDTGSVAASSSFTTGENDSHDLIHLSLSNATNVADFVIAESRNGTDCLFWGEVYSG